MPSQRSVYHCLLLDEEEDVLLKALPSTFLFSGDGLLRNLQSASDSKSRNVLALLPHAWPCLQKAGPFGS